MRRQILALGAFLAFGIWPAAGSAQPPAAPPDWTIAVAGKVWVASGWSNWNFTSAGVDPLSDLRWRGVDAVVGELSADVTWKNRLVWMLSVGGTPTVDQGVLIDDEFAQSNRQGRFSTTRSPVGEGHIFYISNDIGARLTNWRQPLFGGAPTSLADAGYLDVFVGYQYWQEEYVAFGITGNLILGPGSVVNLGEPSSTKNIWHEYHRHSVRLGARTQVPLVGGLSLKALAAISPYTHTDHDDTHHLRTDFVNPSKSSANGGFGVQFETGLSYAVWGGLSAEVGFRYWYFDSGEGDVVTRFVGGVTTRDKLNEAITERYGPYFGVRYRF